MIRIKAAGEFPPGSDYKIRTIRAEQSWQYALHAHVGFCDIVFVVQGTLIEHVNGTRCEYGPGSLVWIRETDCHALQARGFEFINLSVDSGLLMVLLGAVRQDKSARKLEAGPLPVKATVLESDRAGLAAELGQLMLAQGTSRGTLLLGAFIFSVFGRYFLPLADLGADASDCPEWLSYALNVMEATPEKAWTMKDVVKLCGRSSGHVSRTFQRYVGMWPTEYLLAQRLNRAAILLSSTDREILDICFSVGFNSASYFYRVFRKRFGNTPHKYRLLASGSHHALQGR